MERGEMARPTVIQRIESDTRRYCSFSLSASYGFYRGGPRDFGSRSGTSRPPEDGVDRLTGWVFDRTSTHRTRRERSSSLLYPTGCTLGPVAERLEMATCCRPLCGGMTDGYIPCEPTP